jgi:hypothetical protein
MRRLLIYVGHFVTFTAIVPLILVNAADLVRTLFGIPYFGLGYVGIFPGVLTVGLGLAVMAWAEIDMYRYGSGSPLPFYEPLEGLCVKASTNAPETQCTSEHSTNI